MHECIIVFRLRIKEYDGVQVFHDEENLDLIKVFQNRDEAIAFSDGHPFLAITDYQIVELDEL